jgi:uncharacterized protein (UPF0210 family)
MNFSPQEIIETIQMVRMEHLDIRTVTMGISLLDCADSDTDALCRKIYDKIMSKAGQLVPVCETIEKELGIPIINKRISITPIALVAAAIPAEGFQAVARTLDRAASDAGVNFIGGFSALVHKGFTQGDTRLIEALPEALAGTQRVCASVNVATSKAGINMDAVALSWAGSSSGLRNSPRPPAASAARSWWSSATCRRTTPSWPGPSTGSANRRR